MTGDDTIDARVARLEIRQFLSDVEGDLERLHGRMERVMAAMANLEGLVAQINDTVTAVSTEVTALIDKLNTASGGLTADEAAQLGSDLQAALTNLQSVAQLAPTTPTEPPPAP